ncbi:hypothetical protein BHE74_00016683 [Ensete ventricosum]|nr:hypothetical protein BHE74_00016683 [Ensete ventricosum]
MVYLPVNAIGLPLSFLLRPGFLLLGRRERVLGESEDVLCIHGRGFEKFPRIRKPLSPVTSGVALSFLPLPLPSPFSSSPAARAASTVGALVARLPRQGCGHRGNSSPFPAIEDGELAACAALHRSLFLTIEDRSPRVPLMGVPAPLGRYSADGMNKVRFIEPCVVEKRKNGGPQLRPMKVNAGGGWRVAGGGWGVDGEKGVGGIGIGGLSHGPSVGACRGAHLSGLYAEICLIFASFDVRI